MKNTVQPDSVFMEHGGLANAKQLLADGITYYQLKELLASGQVIRLKHGLYRWTDTPVAEMAEVSHLVKKGVFCLYSAAFHYGLTTFVSSEYHLAVPKKYKVVLPAYPPIKLYYWEETAYRTGVQKTDKEGREVDMYDVEKTVCDMVRYRKKVGMDTLKEVLKSYLLREDRNLDKLGKYASAMNIGGEVNNLITLLI